MTDKPEIFFSYAWGGEKEAYAKALYESLHKDGYKVVMDRYEVQYRESFTQFMEHIGRGGFIIVVVSDKYLRSANCMFEMMEIYRKSNSEIAEMAGKIYPIVMGDASIYEDTDILQYTKYWRDKTNSLRNGMVDGMDLVDTADMAGNLKRYNEIANQFGAFGLWLRHRNTLTPEKLAENDFALIKKAIDQAATAIPSHTATAQVKPATTNINNDGTTIAQQFIHSNVQISYGEKQIPKYLSIPFFPEWFTGRETDLAAVQQRFSTPGQLPLLLVNGQGGIGKTSLAAQYYLLHQAQYQHLAWVFAEGSLADALLLLAAPLQLDFDSNAGTAQRVLALLAALRELKALCLLVIDNANGLGDLNQYYPLLRQCPNCHVLITTRVTELQLEAAFYPILPFGEAEALDIFIKHYQGHNRAEDGLFAQVYQAVGGNTLVLELLAKNLRHSNRPAKQYSLANLVADLQTSLLSLGHSEMITTGYRAKGDTPQSARAEAIIEAMYNLGELGQEERALLAIFAVLPAENILYTTLLTLLPQRAALQATLMALAAKGWLDYNEAAFSFKISPVIQEITRAKNPDLLEDCRDLIVSLYHQLKYDLGTGHLLNASYDEARLCARYAEILFKQIAAADNDLYILLDRLGSYHTTTGNLPLALHYYQAANQRIEVLCQAHPDDTDYKNNLAVSYNYLGNIQASLGELTKALGFYEDETKLYKELFDAHPNNMSFQYGLTVSYSKLGETYSQMGNLDKALVFNELDANLSKELFEAYPDNLGFKNGLAVAYSKLGDTYSAMGELPKALGFYEERSRIGKELFEAYPDNVSFKNGLAAAYGKLGETYTEMGELSKALGFYERYLTLMQELFEAYTDNVGFKNGLALSYQWLGWFYEDKLRDSEKAMEYYRLSKPLLVELVDKFPAYVAFTKNLNWVNEKLPG